MKKILLKKYAVGLYDDVSPFISDGDLEIQGKDSDDGRCF